VESFHLHTVISRLVAHIPQESGSASQFGVRLGSNPGGGKDREHFTQGGQDLPRILQEAMDRIGDRPGAGQIASAVPTTRPGEANHLTKQRSGRKPQRSATLKREVAAWQVARNRAGRGVNWRFTTEDAVSS
jgi:hypothetical protein